MGGVHLGRKGTDEAGGKEATLHPNFLPTFFKKLKIILETNGGSFLVEKGLTWADIFIGTSLEAIEITTDVFF